MGEKQILKDTLREVVGYLQQLIEDPASFDRDLAEWKIERAERVLATGDPCPYTFAHTRHWCGYKTCRDS